ncbi:MAG: hypothetical protein ACI841_003424 [Planctomycetota bacterium]|jgi:hypothetical protein
MFVRSSPLASARKSRNRRRSVAHDVRARLVNQPVDHVAGTQRSALIEVDHQVIDHADLCAERSVQISIPSPEVPRRSVTDVASRGEQLES